MRIPTYREPTQQVTVKQTADAPAAAFGTLNAQAMQQAGQTVQDVGSMLNKRALILQEERNKAKVKEAEAAIMNWQIDWLHNPEKGAYMRRGSSAINVTKETIKAQEEQAKSIAASLENDAQRSLLNDRMTTIQERLMEQVSKFERDELYNYGRAAGVAVTKSYEDAAAAAATNPEMSEMYLQGVYEKMLEDPRTPPAEAKLYVDRLRSRNILRGIQQNIDQGEYAAGIQMYDRYKDFIIGEEAQTAAGIAENARISVKTTGIANEIVGRTGTLADAVKEARAFEETEGQKFTEELVTRVKKQHAERQMQVDSERSAAVRQAWDGIEQGAGPEVIPIWASQGQRKSMLKAIEDKASGKETQTDPSVLVKLKKEYLEKPTQFATKDISGDLNSLSYSDRKQVLTWQAEAAAGLSDSQLKANRKKQLTASQIEREGRLVLRQSFGDGWLRKNIGQRDEYLNRLDQEVEMEAERLGKDSLTREEVQAVATRLLREGKVQRSGFFDRTAREYELTPEEKSKFYIPYGNIPEKDIVEIRKAIALNNKAMLKSGQRDRLIPNTREGVERLYNAKQFNRSMFEPGLSE